MEKKLTDAAFPFAHKHIAFPNLSHAMMIDGSPMYKLFFKSERQHPKECTAEREQLKKEILSWITQVW